MDGEGRSRLVEEICKAFNKAQLDAFVRKVLNRPLEHYAIQDDLPAIVEKLLSELEKTPRDLAVFVDKFESHKTNTGLSPCQTTLSERTPVGGLAATNTDTGNDQGLLSEQQLVGATNQPHHHPIPGPQHKAQLTRGFITTLLIAISIIAALIVATFYVRNAGQFSTILLLIHFLSNGIQSFVVKTTSRKGLPSESVIFFSSLTTFGLAATLIAGAYTWNRHSVEHMLQPIEFWKWLSIFMAIGGVYFLISYARFRGQSSLPSFVFEPLARYHLLIVLPVSMYFLEKAPSNLELISLFLVVVSVVWVTSLNSTSETGKTKSLSLRNTGVAWLFASGIAAAGLQLLTAVLMINKFPFIFYIVFSNFASCLFAMLAHPSRSVTQLVPSMLFGVITGLLNFVTLISLLVFLTNGQPSRIYSASALSMTIPVALLLFDRNSPKPTVHQLIAFAFALAAFLFQAANRQ